MKTVVINGVEYKYTGTFTDIEICDPELGIKEYTKIKSQLMAQVIHREKDRNVWQNR